jgi:ankyrin repeat protein
MSTNTYTVADLCGSAEIGDTDRISEILGRNPELVNVCVAENDEHRELHFAVLNQHTEAVRMLMEAGADPGSGIYPHRDATTPLVMAEERGYDDIVTVIRDADEKLKLAACKNITISQENESLFKAVDEGRDADAIVILDQNPDLLDACQKNGGSVIYTSASRGRYALVQELLKRGADITHLTPSGASPLDGAVQNWRGKNRPDNYLCLLTAGMLLQAGCQLSLESAIAIGDINFVKDFAGKSPERFKRDEENRDGLLQIAVANDQIGILKLLLGLGLHPDDRHRLKEYENRPFSWGEPLAMAAGSSRYEIAHILLEAGADPNPSIYASGNAVSQAYNNRDKKMQGLLFRYGGTLEPTFAGLEGETAAAVLALQHDPNLAGKLLWAAGCGGDIDLAGACLRVLDWGPDDSQWFNSLEQPLRIWRCNPHRKYPEYDRSVYPEIFKMILQHGANPNITGRFGYRLAHRIAACGAVWGKPIMTEEERVKFASILLDFGADLNVTDDLLLSSPLGWAVRWGRYELSKLYLERGADPALSGEEWSTPLAWAAKKGHKEIAQLLESYL